MKERPEYDLLCAEMKTVMWDVEIILNWNCWKFEAYFIADVIEAYFISRIRYAEWVSKKYVI